VKHAPVDITSLTRASLRDALSALGEPAYRAKQVLSWLYLHRVTSFDEMTDLSKELRHVLAERYKIVRPRIVEQQASVIDDTRKYLFELSGGATVEAVGLPTKDRLTVCFSTQAGCAMGCVFCATGRDGLTRDLHPGEMVGQVLAAANDFERRVTNAVAMGQGEPFANYDATLEALRLLNDPSVTGIGARHLTVSTCGLIGGIVRLAGEPEQFTLAISLHSAVQETRDRLMPGVKGHDLRHLRRALEDYTKRTGRRVTLEYALMSGINDSDQEFDSLVRFAKGLLCHINLIPVNPVSNTGLERPDPLVSSRFATRLSGAGIETTVRAERGADIDAACGQLRQRHRSALPTDPCSEESLET